MRELTPMEKWNRQLTEADVQRVIVDALNTYGYLCYHTHDSRGSDRGFPDLAAVHRTTGVVLFFECKTEIGRLRPEQIEWAHALERSSCPYSLVRPSTVDYALRLIRMGAGGDE